MSGRRILLIAQLAGLASVVAGVALVWVPAALMVAGVCLVAVGELHPAATRPLRRAEQ